MSGSGSDEPRIPEHPRDLKHADRPSQSSVSGRREAKLLSQGKDENELAREAKRAEAGRTERFRDNFEFIAIASLYIVWLAIVLIGAVWIYHLVMPSGWHFLPDDRIDTIQALVTGGVLVSVAIGHARKRLDG